MTEQLKGIFVEDDPAVRFAGTQALDSLILRSAHLTPRVRLAHRFIPTSRALSLRT